MAGQQTAVRKAKPGERKRCTCITQANEQLAKDNARIARTMLLNLDSSAATISGAMIVVEKIDSKKRTKLPTLFASYCPICGKKYPD